jgi:hypothetical protein
MIQLLLSNKEKKDSDLTASTGTTLSENTLASSANTSNLTGPTSLDLIIKNIS